MTDERLDNAGSQAMGAATATPPVIESPKAEEKAVAAPKAAKAPKIVKRGRGRPKGSKNQTKRVGRPKGSKRVANVNLTDLEQELSQKQAALAEAQNKRIAEVMDQLKAVDAALVAVGVVTSKRRGRKPGKKVAKVAKVAKAKKSARGRRAPGSTLPDFITKVLKRRTNGMPVSELEDAVKKAGYQTTSTNLKPMIAAALRDGTRFKRVSRGVYATK